MSARVKWFGPAVVGVAVAVCGCSDAKTDGPQPRVVEAKPDPRIKLQTQGQTPVGAAAPNKVR